MKTRPTPPGPLGSVQVLTVSLPRGPTCSLYLQTEIESIFIKIGGKMDAVPTNSQTQNIEASTELTVERRVVC